MRPMSSIGSASRCRCTAARLASFQCQICRAASTWTGDARAHRREAVAYDADRTKPAEQRAKQPSVATAFLRRARHRARAFGRPRCRPLQPHWPPGLVARTRCRCDASGVRLPPAHPRRRPHARATLLPPGAKHGASGATAADTANKDSVGPLIEHRWPHVLSHVSSFGWHCEPRRPAAHGFHFGSEDTEVAYTPPSQGGRRSLTTASAGEEEMVGDGGASAGGLPWRPGHHLIVGRSVEED
jgi:hypothetical protein